MDRSSAPSFWFDKIKTSQSSGLLMQSKKDQLSYQEFFTDLAVLLAWFYKKDLKKGDRALVAMKEDKNSVLLILAMMRYGLSITAFDPDAPLAEAQQMFGIIRPKLVCAADKTMAEWKSAEALDVSCEIILAEGDLPSLLSQPLSSTNESGVNFVEPAEDDISLVIYTSGTTGKPKGVCLSYRAVFQQSLDMAKQIDITSKSVILNMFRFYQIGGIVNGILLAFLNGATLFRPYNIFSLEKLGDLYRQINEVKASHFILVPSFLSILLHRKQDFVQTFSMPFFRYFISTADLLPEAMWSIAEELSGKVVVNTYGLTEANTLTFSALDRDLPRRGTIGRPNNCRHIIVDENRLPVAKGEKGELVVSGKTVMEGYFDDEERAALVLKDGWFYTGDFMWENSDGNLVYMGRKANVIVCGGHTIFPDEITAHLMDHEDILQAYTLGLPHESWGEVVVTCIVMKKKETSSNEIAAFLRGRLSAYKIPRRFVFMDIIPISDRGKVKRSEILSIINQNKK